MNKLQVELIQLAILLVYILLAGRREKTASVVVVIWWCCVLAIDIFIWRGNRPAYVRDWLNIFDVSIGAVLIYAKSKNPIKHVLALFLSLFR